MFNALRRTAALWASMVVILFAAATAAYSQAPTDAQRSAIRSQCRSDYEAHCASVPPGGKASLQCLQQNMSSLSSGCQAAVRAVEAPAAPKPESTPAAPKAESAPAAPKAESAPAAPAESAPAASTAKPAAETAAPPAASNPPPAAKAAASTATKKPSSAQVSAIRSACRNDYPQHCAGVPTGGAAALSCLEKNRAKLVGEQLEAGMVGVNTFAISVPESPFGGVKESGHGSEEGIEGLEACLVTKFISEA